MSELKIDEIDFFKYVPDISEDSKVDIKIFVPA